MEPSDGLLPIGTVERETGLSKDVLRAWERRYGFPSPQRDAHGDRVYPTAQVRRLRLLKRLLDHGRRPGRIVGLSEEELEALLAQWPDARPSGDSDGLLALLHEADPPTVERFLQHELAARGLREFVTESLPRMNREVGDAWMRGAVSVFEEHLYSEQVQNVLRQAVQQLPSAPDARPRVVLTTLPGEQHGLGLLMVHTVLRLTGADVRSFGVQMPLTEIVAAVERQDADIVALSFSAAYPPTAVAEDLAGLRGLLPPRVAIWAGGEGVSSVRNLPEGVRRMELNTLERAGPPGEPPQGP